MQCLSEQISFDPAADFSAFLASLPAKWAVYLLSDTEGKPFQLLSVKNLRASISNRLCEHPQDEKTRSIHYREIVRRISWTRVSSQAEADWVYAQLAKRMFPADYRRLLESWSAWYVTIDPEAQFPRYTLTDSPEWEASRTTFGPITTKNAAQRWIELIEDSFDLCRYHNILVQAPHGQACAYKGMHKCPAPCDGSISLSVYHHQIEESLRAIGNPVVIAQHEERMRQAAVSLKFEIAGRIKGYITQLRGLTSGPYQQLRPISLIRQMAVLRGPSAGTFKLMLLTPERVELTGEWTDPATLAATLDDYASHCDVLHAWEDRGNLAFISHLLLAAYPDCIMAAPEIAAIQAACTQLSRRKQDTESADEGVLQQAQIV